MGQGPEDLDTAWAKVSNAEAAAIKAVVKHPRPKRCYDCGKAWADYPSNLCVTCDGYRDHSGEF